MCIKRIAAECPRYSYVTFEGEEYYIDLTDEMAVKEKVMLVAADGSGAIIVDFRTEVESHLLSPIEARRIGSSPCAKGLHNHSS